LSLVNNILASASSTGPVALVDDGGTVSGGFNLVVSEQGVGAGVIHLSADPQLVALADNGGPTQTHELQSTNPALNAGTRAGAPTTDQRGVLRGASINLGAYQASPNALGAFGFPSPQTAGVPRSFTVTARSVDQFGKSVFGYSGPVQFSATGQSSVPGPSSLPGGSGTFTAVLSTPGAQRITAIDPLLGISGSQVVEVIPAPPARVATTTTLSASPNPALVGQSVTFTASVADATGSPITIGKVDFLEGNTTLGSVNLDGRQQVTLSTTFNTPGTHKITARYEGATVGNNALQPSDSV